MKNLLTRYFFVVAAMLICPGVFAQWWTTGNTAGPTDFLGTTNIVSLKFKTDNVERMRLMGDIPLGMRF
jgi:hypothetical protein